MKFEEKKYDNQPQWNSIIFSTDRGNTQVEIGSLDKDGDVEFFITEGNESTTFFLDKENIRHLITHLQKQL